MTDAGLKDARVERTAERPTFSSGQEMWDWVLYGNPIPGVIVGDLSEEQRARLRKVLDGILRERAGRDGRATLTNRVNIGIGVSEACRGLYPVALAEAGLAAAIESLGDRRPGLRAAGLPAERFAPAVEETAYLTIANLADHWSPRW